MQYPTITVTWTREDADYEANFAVNYIKYSVVYSANAVRKIVESDASFTALPQAVQDAAHKEFDDEDIRGAAVLQDYVGNQTKYEVAIVESAKKKWDLIFDVNGNLLQKIRVCD